jgi:hypothetical protein
MLNWSIRPSVRQCIPSKAYTSAGRTLSFSYRCDRVPAMRSYATRFLFVLVTTLLIIIRSLATASPSLRSVRLRLKYVIRKQSVEPPPAPRTRNVRVKQVPNRIPSLRAGGCQRVRSHGRCFPTWTLLVRTMTLFRGDFRRENRVISNVRTLLVSLLFRYPRVSLPLLWDRPLLMLRPVHPLSRRWQRHDFARTK